MRHTLKLLGVIGVLSVIFAFGTPERKIEKLISKVWKGQTLETMHVELPDTLKGMITSLQEVRLNGKKIGYACYTTAFGCRVGGCSAPSTNANVQSYETFDYIVVYDDKLNIKKIDIANYGGEYGYEICRAKWLQQFAGSTSGFKLNENIDGITGATVSATFLIDDVNALGKVLTKLNL